jgi:3-isopropylmalate/(R)-2-methylmalate dehydratase small subunit
MKIWNYSTQNGINTDMLFPGKYTYTCATPDEIKPHLLEDLDPDFAREVQPGDIVIAGTNFGCGSSREQPVVGLKAVGVAAVIAKGFARIFFRAAINQGLTLIESPEAVDAFKETSRVSLDIENGSLEIDGNIFTFPPLPDDIKAIQMAGGLLPYTKKLLADR